MGGTYETCPHQFLPGLIANTNKISLVKFGRLLSKSLFNNSVLALLFLITHKKIRDTQIPANINE